MSKYRSSSNTRYLKALFFEETGADKSTVLYTLKDQDHLGFPSLYRLYMELDDLTEWEFANKYLDGWEHWQMLCDCTWFKPYIARWRTELELKTRAAALRALKVAATGEGNSSYHANKLLLEGGWKTKEGSTRGRPTKAQVEKEAIMQAEQHLKINKDYERLTNDVSTPASTEKIN